MPHVCAQHTIKKKGKILSFPAVRCYTLSSSEVFPELVELNPRSRNHAQTILLGEICSSSERWLTIILDTYTYSRAHTRTYTLQEAHKHTRTQTISHKHPNNRTQTRGNSNKHKLAITNARKPAFAHKHLHTNMHTRTNTNTNTQIQTQTVTLSGYKNLLP